MITKGRLLAVVVGLALLVLGSYWLLGWSRLESYQPGDVGAFQAPFRTMAEHNQVMRGREWPYILELEAASGALLYFGSRHTDDPTDPQIAQMAARWDAFSPTVALTENRLGLFIGTPAMGISAFGEFAQAAALGRRDDLPVYSLEPTWEVEVAEMKAAFPVAEVTLFYTLRVFMSERGSERDRAALDRLASHLLEKRGSRPGLEGSLPDLAAFDRLWDERFGDLGPWRELPREACDPSAEPTRLQALAVLANEVRDRHAARVLIDLVSRGERVFAIAGGSHVVKQEPVLRAALGLSQVD
ncbi:MAG: hypothetical protein AAF604_00135 [Acidobacteriota bacterium]